jgi:arabinan endo-1,5-alpha-L-arabinosidase
MTETKRAGAAGSLRERSRKARAARLLALCALTATGVGATACGSSGPKYTVAPVDSTRIPNAQQYLNPVLDADFPDPVALRASDGTYYAYATQTTGRHIQVARSTDLVSWSSLGDALPAVPAWATQSQNFWAPDVHERAGQFVMYFAAQIDAAQRIHPDDGFCIGMATATTGAGPFTDVGAPVVCGPGFTTIDPMGFDDPQTGKHYLYWGSAGSPIVVRELAADRRTFVDSAPVALLSPRSSADGNYDTGLIEGPWVLYHAPYYYLFFSGNNCCGSGAHYAVMVARSSAATGPFVVLTAAGSAAAKPILEANSMWIAPGHNSTVTDGAGAEWMLYHAIDPNHPYLFAGNTSISRRPMLLDRITWVNDWPVVAGSGTPSALPQTRPMP